MDDNADLHDWELLHASDFTENYACVVFGEIKDDYFAFDSCSSQRLQSEESEEGGIDSDNPSCPDSDSNAVLEAAKDLGFDETAPRMQNSGGFLSDGKSSVVEMGSEEKREDVEDEVDEGSDRSELGEMGEIGWEKKEEMWWKVPFGLVKYCLVGMRPVWSLSIAAAVVGIVMLWRKMYRVKQKSRRIQLKLGFDDKKTSQFAARSARLNAAFSVVRRMPAIRPSLQEGVATQWAALPLR